MAASVSVLWIIVVTGGSAYADSSFLSPPFPVSGQLNDTFWNIQSGRMLDGSEGPFERGSLRCVCALRTDWTRKRLEVGMYAARAHRAGDCCENNRCWQLCGKIVSWARAVAISSSSFFASLCDTYLFCLFWEHNKVINVKLCTVVVLPIHATFRDLDHISRSQQHIEQLKLKLKVVILTQSSCLIKYSTFARIIRGLDREAVSLFLFNFVHCFHELFIRCLGKGSFCQYLHSSL